MGLLVAALSLTRKVPMPVVITIGLALLVTSNYGIAILRPNSVEFFFIFVFPYLLVVVLGYVGAHVVSDLGREVPRAKDLGNYHLVERLGQGGMGEVWRAQHRLLARPAAIKLVRPSLIETGGAHDGALRRFEREAQVTAQLRSPHTVELWDYGQASDGAFYYVMELLDGLDLEALVNRHGPVPAERAIHLLRQVCHSLAEAESKGLVHRDIKPSNIFLCRYGGDYDFVKVLDFGIVKATDTSETETGLYATSTMLVQGTPAFIAPEQALGGGAIDGRADIYAAGCVAYWLLTGQLVFTADTVMGTIMHHAHTAPTPPSERSELEVPHGLDELVMACLAKDPAGRPQTASELSRRLAGIACQSEWNQERSREWWIAHYPIAATAV